MGKNYCYKYNKKRCIGILVILILLVCGACDKEKPDLQQGSVTPTGIGIQQEQKADDLFQVNIWAENTGKALQYHGTADEAGVFEFDLCMNLTVGADFPAEAPTVFTVLCDGKLAECSIDSMSCVEGRARVNLQTGRAERVHFEVAAGEASLVTIHCSFYPERLPESYQKSKVTAIAYTFRMDNRETLDAYAELPAMEEYMVEVEGTRENVCVDVGNVPITEENPRDTEGGLDYVLVHSAEKPLYLKFNSGDDVDYCLFVTIDGEIIAPFDGEALLRVNSAGGTKTFCYPLPMDCMDEGEHVVQLSAIPAMGEGKADKESMKVKVICQ